MSYDTNVYPHTHDGMIGSAELRRTLGVSVRQLFYLFEQVPGLDDQCVRLPDGRKGFRRRYPPSFVTRLDVAARFARSGASHALPSITRAVFEHEAAPAEGQLAVYQSSPDRITYLDDPGELPEVLDPDGGVVVFLHDLHGAPGALAPRTAPAPQPQPVPFRDYTEE